MKESSKANVICLASRAKGYIRDFLASLPPLTHSPRAAAASSRRLFLSPPWHHTIAERSDLAFPSSIPTTSAATPVGPHVLSASLMVMQFD